MAEQEKSAAELLQEKLLIKTENGGLVLSDSELETVDAFCEDYKKFLNDAKTEHEAVKVTVELLKSKGYQEFEAGKKYAAGEKVYYNNRGKALVFATIGTKGYEEGVKIIASHIDAPRLDMKPRPLYEEAQLAYLKTHYYGGIKKYQWGAIPLALHGVIVKKDGTTIEISVGEDEGDPIFCVTDLLPHLGREQMKRPLSEGLKGEELNILIGCRPFRDDKASEKVKLNIANILFEKYGITEYDFLSAELEAVPAFDAKDLGFDRSMIGSYGHDDRVCAYTSLKAAVEVENPAYTTVTVLADKEEIGSNGNTGLKCAYLRYFIADLAAPYGVEARTVLSHSQCLSADVNAAFDPNFPDVYERKNTAYLNYGVVVTKYTGSGGKGGTSEASAHFMAKIRKLLDDKKVLWQVGELGKVDAGGGGTVAMYIAELNVDVVDVGVPVLSMHAPFEVVSKVDVYMAYRAFREFLSEK
ncbi:aminopeptidase [Hydrogenoanaerobacterium sp.]|uniref:aminopeptidase n=1 Tax=Hydrogenoanaerobacterium sp. TaxID=2953763 RepID=UPI0028974DB7|nr:aminopeptidase [Hydrogenoanaerobacterium sp.]